MDGLKTIEKKIKGYGYDSLCLRYNIARDKQMEYELIVARKAGELNKEDSIRQLAKRDKLRFYEILDDLIGEHD